MGKGIVYCGDCGKVLHEGDFEKGLAHIVENAPYCTACRAASAPPASALTSSSTKMRAARLPKAAPSTVRRVASPAPADSRKTLLIGGGIAGGAALLLVVVTLAVGGGGGSSGEPKVSQPETEGPEAALIRNLAAFAASSKDPDAILLKCDEVRRRVAGTPHAAKLAEIETRALEMRQKGDWERQLTRSLEEARKLAEGGREKEEEALRLLTAARGMARHRVGEVDRALGDLNARRVDRRLEEAQRIRSEDPLFVRWEEVGKLLAEAKGLDAARSAEVAKRQADYERARKASPVAGRLGPFELDDSGAILNWLLLGPFPNDEHKGYEEDALGGEASHAFASGVEVKRAGQGPLKWAAHASPDSVVDFFVDTPLKLTKEQPWIINYGACWVYAPDATDLKLKVSTDDGYKLWVDGAAFSGKHEHRGINPSAEDMEAYPLRLGKGLHRLLIKVEQGDGGHQFRVRLQKPDGSRPEGLRVFN